MWRHVVSRLCRSFTLLWSSLVGNLQAIDIGYVKRDLATWSWAMWPEVVEYLRKHLGSLPADQVSFLHANVISHILIKRFQMQPAPCWLPTPATSWIS